VSQQLNRLRLISRLAVALLLSGCLDEDPATPSLAVDSIAPMMEVDEVPPDTTGEGGGTSSGGSGTLSTSLVSYLGGSQDEIVRDVAIDAQGNIYITGGTTSPDFPVTTGAFDVSFNNPGSTKEDVFIQKRGPGGKVIWSTFLGGSGFDRAYAIEVDANGFVYVAGRAGGGLPVTAGAAQTIFRGGANTGDSYGPQDGFVCKLRSDGAALVYCTYFGNDDYVPVRDITVDGSGNVYLATSSDRGTFPSAWFTNSYQKTRRGKRDMLIAKLNAAGSAIVWATYLGGTGDELNTNSVRLDGSGNVYAVTTTHSTDAPTPNGFDHIFNGGSDVYLVKLSPTGSQLLYGTYVGGSNADHTETHNLEVASNGEAFVAAMTRSTDLKGVLTGFQKTFQGAATQLSNGLNGNYSGDGMVVRVATGGALLGATYVGGKFGDGLEGVTINALGEVYVSGTTYSPNMPVTTSATLAGNSDVFVMKLTRDLSTRLFATTLGGAGADSGRGSDVDSGGNMATVGTTKSSNLPLVNSTQGARRGATDGIVVKMTSN